VGEVGVTGVAAAVANAVHHATGVRVRDLPMTPDRLQHGAAHP
jgi:xanthine dehydrogenase YagR molybdenum-binding subunit